jgi:methionyl-tRNA formyltransferase
MRVVFIGTGEIGLPTLRTLQKSEHELAGVVTQPDKPAGRDQKITPPPIRAAVSGAQKSILQPARIKDRQSIERIRALQPDVIVVMAYRQILPREVLGIPKFACLNLHASLLPRWRGAAPIQAAIGAGDCETGITVMYMDEGLDTGDVLLQHKIDILPNDTGGTLHDRLAQVAPESLLQALHLLATGNAPRIQQDDALATYAPRLKREDGQIDWNKPAEVIERKIRAFNPWPGTFTKIAMQPDARRNLKIFGAVIVDLHGRPGEILRTDNELIVATGKGALALGDVQLEGKRRMNATEFLRGAPELKVDCDLPAPC